MNAGPDEPVEQAVASGVGRLRARVGEQPAAVLTIAVGLTLAAVMALLAAGVYDAVSEADGIAGLDRPVLDRAVGWRSPGLDSAVTAFTNLGGVIGMSILATGCAVALAIAWRRWVPLVVMAVATTGSVLMTTVGKAVVGRVRPPSALAVPPLETSASFPSGHSLNSVVVAGVMAYLVLQRVRRRAARVAVVVAAAIFAVAMGLSRVFLGHHWLTDVLVAWALGLAWLAVVLAGARIWLLRGRTPA
jgi:undecaprenyl-diphosphatase